MKNLLAVLCSAALFVMVVVGAFALVPDPDSADTSASTSTNLRMGNVPDLINGGTGVPFAPTVLLYFDAPATADVDFYVTSVTTGTGSKTYTLAQTAAAFPRNVTATISGGNTTGTLTITGFVGQRTTTETETLTWTAGQTGRKDGVKAFRKITGVTSSFDTARTVTVGFGNRFSLGYPMWSTLNNNALFDDDGADYPNTSMSTDITWTAGDPTDTTADYLGTVLLGADNATGAKTPNGTRDYVVTFTGSKWVSSAIQPVY